MGGMMTPGISDDEHKKKFEERLKRIQRGAPNTMSQIYVGEATGGGNSRPASAVRLGGWMAATLALPVAAVLGALSMAIGRFGSYHLASDEGAFTVAALSDFSPHLGGLMGAILLGSLVCIILRWSFRLSRPMQALAMLLGFSAALFGEAQMLERAPGLFAALYSESYVLDRLYPDMPASLDAPLALPPADAQASL
jgi:hypothetical protein